VKGQVVSFDAIKTESRSIFLEPLVLNFARRRRMFKFSLRSLYPRKRSKVPVEEVTWWAPE